MKTVLVIDDDPIIVRILTVALEVEGYFVISASNGEDGLQAAVEEDPDIIILDIMMPLMDGLKMLEELRKTSDVPVIVMSADGSHDKVERARELGIECFVNKPFRTTVIVEILDLIFSMEDFSQLFDR
jgi:DNA-binding response OmpR family regulator